MQTYKEWLKLEVTTSIVKVKNFTFKMIEMHDTFDISGTYDSDYETAWGVIISLYRGGDNIRRHGNLWWVE